MKNEDATELLSSNLNFIRGYIILIYYKKMHLAIIVAIIKINIRRLTII